MFFSKSGDKRKTELSNWFKEYKIETIQNLEQINKLDLSFKDIDKLPKQIDCLINLETLILSNNNLSSLPSEIKNLKKLTSVNLGYNRFTEVPTELLHLTSLEYLNLEANLIKKISNSIGNLSQLKELNLFANQISELPEEFCNLKNLTRLNLALNQLSNLPKNFSKLENITVLELWLNKFDLIPDVISQLRNLKDLYSAVDPDKLNSTLIWAVIGNNVQLADKLIFNGADVNFQYEECQSREFTTPLFEAKSFDMITLLLTMGADPELKREIVKYVVTKDGEEKRHTGQYETFLTMKHPKELQKFINAYISSSKLMKK